MGKLEGLMAKAVVSGSGRSTRLGVADSEAEGDRSERALIEMIDALRPQHPIQHRDGWSRCCCEPSETA